MEGDDSAATVLVRKGENCTALEFVERRTFYSDETCASVSFFASKNTSYVIRFRFLQNFNPQFFNFTLNGTIAMRPPNDECATAILLDPSVSPMKISGTTKDSVTDSVYYKIKVGMEKEYEIFPQVCAEKSVDFTAIEVSRGDDCEKLHEERIFFFNKRCNTFSFRVSKNSTYFLSVSFRRGRQVDYIGSTFNMTSTSRIAIPPPNDECVEAIPVDPLARNTITGNTIDSYDGKAYYKFNVGTLNDLAINITVCSELLFSAYVYKGNDCDRLVNVKARLYEFGSCRTTSIIASKRSSYIFSLVPGIYDLAKGKHFNASFTSRMANSPPNDECADAIVVDPFDETTFFFDTTESSSGSVFYQLNVGSVKDIAMSITVCGDGGVSVRNSDCIGFHDIFYDEKIFYVGDGDDSCGTVSFLTSMNRTYFIELHGMANVTLKSRIYSMPLNIQCTKASSIDPVAGERFVAKLGDSLSEVYFIPLMLEWNTILKLPSNAAANQAKASLILEFLTIANTLSQATQLNRVQRFHLLHHLTPTILWNLHCLMKYIEE
jgi:hypothetical protein